MATITHDTVEVVASRQRIGLALALASATTFGLSGPLAKALIETGWTPAAAVTLRSLIAATVLIGPALLSLRGRWHLLRDNVGLLVFYGVVPVAGTQLAYFTAVAHLQVSVALLIEYAAPVAVVTWLWLRHGHRPTGLTLLGAALSIGGLVLVLDLFSGARLDTVGVLCALGAMVGCAVYFVVNASTANGLPPLVLAAGGLLVGGSTMVLAALVGLVSWHASSADVALAGRHVPVWLPVLAIGTVASALAYVTGIEAARLLGPRLSSFASLFEVLASLVFSWLLVAQVLHPVQLLGGLLLLAGVLVVQRGDSATITS